MNELKKYVDDVAQDLRGLYDLEITDEEREQREADGEPCDLWEYLADVLDVNYTIDYSGELIGCRIAVTLGGPNVYIDTVAGEVRGYWGSERETAWIPSEICDEINEIMADGLQAVYDRQSSARRW